MIVFPEDGLTGFEFSTPEFFIPFLQVVPLPGTSWVPCTEPGIMDLKA